MTDEQTQQAQEKPEGKAQAEAKPTSEQKAPPAQKVAEPAARESEQPKEKEGLELPEGVKERTSQQFERLKKQLADEKQRRVRLERSFQLNQPPQVGTTPSTPEWFDPTTSEVDVGKLGMVEAQREQKLASLEQRVLGMTKAEEQRQEQEAYQDYPELNPTSEGFDDSFQEQVINAHAVAIAKGENPTLKETADSVMKIAQRVAKKAEKEGAKKALESLEPKEQASLEATGRSDRRLPSQDLGQLRAQTKSGGAAGLDAVRKRLSQIPSV